MSGSQWLAAGDLAAAQGVPEIRQAQCRTWVKCCAHRPAVVPGGQAVPPAMAAREIASARQSS